MDCRVVNTIVLTRSLHGSVPVGNSHNSQNFHMDVFQLAMTITHPSSDSNLLQLTIDGMVFPVD